MSEKHKSDVIEVVDSNRVFAFSDGVFAFAATLLVIKIDLPAFNGTAGDMGSAFGLLWPQYVINIVTFLIIGHYWINHHSIFGTIKRFNTGLVWLNIIFLISVATLPFPVDLYGDYPTTPWIVAFYSLSVATVGILLYAVWFYASNKHKLIAANLSDRFIDYYNIKLIIPPIVFVCSIPLVYVHPFLAPASWILVVVALLLFKKMYRVHESDREIETLV